MVDRAVTQNPGCGLMFKRPSPPVILQAETFECGLACLGMILAAHGRHISLSVLREKFTANRSLSLEQIAQTAQHYGLDVRALRCEPADLPGVKLPAILHVDFNHYIVLTECNGSTYAVIDPARGRQLFSTESLSARFTGILLEFTPTTRFNRGGRRQSYSPFRLLGGLPWSELSKALTVTLLLSLCIQIFALISPFFLQVVVDEVIASGSSQFALVVVLGFGAVYLLSTLTQWLRGLLVIYIGEQLSYVMAAGLHTRLLSLSARYFARRSVGDVVSRFGSMRPLQEFVTKSGVTILLDLMMLSTCWLMLACYSPGAALFTLIAVGLAAAVNYLLSLPYRRFSHEQVVAEAEAQSHFIETIQSIHEVKRFEAEVRRTSIWLNQLTISINAHIKASRYQLYAELSRFLLSAALLLGVVWIALDDIITTTLTIGMLYAMVSYTNYFTQAALSLLHEWQNFLMLYLHTQRLSDITEQVTPSRQPLTTEDSCTIVFNRVTFAYPESARTLIDEVSFTVDAGQTLAITGSSGSGKSTLLRLLLAELSPTRGEISIGGRPLTASVCPGAVFSCAMAEDRLIAGSVSQNITFNEAALDMARVIDCAKAAMIHEDILRLPLGYQEKVSDVDSGLSAGQRQRLLLARALYRGSDFLLLDEGTSYLDAATELAVMRAVLDQPRGCIFVTHRPAVASLADQQVHLA